MIPIGPIVQFDKRQQRIGSDKIDKSVTYIEMFLIKLK